MAISKSSSKARDFVVTGILTKLNSVITLRSIGL
jgi:hypothetical protein